MHRREFLRHSATIAGAAFVGAGTLSAKTFSKSISRRSILDALATQTLPRKFSAADTVTLGSTGIKTSRLAMGTGTVGTGHHSHQTALGIKGLWICC